MSSQKFAFRSIHFCYFFPKHKVLYKYPTEAKNIIERSCPTVPQVTNTFFLSQFRIPQFVGFYNCHL